MSLHTTGCAGAASTPKNYDSITDLENRKEIVRTLIRRYGIIFSALMTKEQDGINWSYITPALQSMELSGEIISGIFFDNIQGIQFTNPQYYSIYSTFSVDHSWYWLNAADPVSLAGIPVPILKADYPKRINTTRLVFRGSKLMAVFYKDLSEIDLFVGEDNTAINKILAYYNQFMSLLNKNKVEIKKINNHPPGQSKYLNSFLNNDFIIRNRKMIKEIHY